jgi:hypothetical protein
MTLAIFAEPALQVNKDGVILVRKTRVTLDTVANVYATISFCLTLP